VEPPKTFWQFLVGVFSEADGTPSYSRICSALCTLTAILLLTVKALKTGQVPTGPEIIEYLTGANAAYLANKVNGLLAAPKRKVEQSKVKSNFFDFLPKLRDSTFNRQIPRKAMTSEQLEFIRKHGVTKCPPGPEFRVVWGGRPRRREPRELGDAGEPGLRDGGLRIRSLYEPAFREQWPRAIRQPTDGKRRGRTGHRQ
jgi:hypothetical protein